MADQIKGGSAAMIIYTRTDKFMKDKNGVYGQIGTMEVLGQLYDTIERCDRVALAGGRTYICKLQTAKTKYVGKGAMRRLRKQIRPMNHGKLAWKKDEDGNYVYDAKGNHVLVEAAILIHAATTPSELEGCIGPGFLKGSYLDSTAAAAENIWDACGGIEDGECQLKVIGDMKRPPKPKG